MLPMEPVDRLSRTITSWPSSSSRSARCEPMNPAPPVMNAFTRRCALSECLFAHGAVGGARSECTRRRSAAVNCDASVDTGGEKQLDCRTYPLDVCIGQTRMERQRKDFVGRPFGGRATSGCFGAVHSGAAARQLGESRLPRERNRVVNQCL